MYIVLVVGGYTLFVMDAYPRIPNMYMDAYHKYVTMDRGDCVLAMTNPSTLV